MDLLPVTKKEIIKELDALPPERLTELKEFIEFLRFKSEKRPRQETWQTALAATSGMWADRDDVAQDGVEYVQNIRRGHRLNDFVEPVDETD